MTTDVTSGSIGPTVVAAPAGLPPGGGPAGDRRTPGAPSASHRTGGRTREAAFEVSLEVFEGPFDLLLSLIARHQLDVTEVALSKVTDDFLAQLRARGRDWDLGQASQFLVVAATLLDLKTARLLPAAEVEDEEDLALLEARDLLFARLLQYRAYRQAADVLAARFAEQARWHPRAVSLEPGYAQLLPEVLLGMGPRQLAALAARALTPRPAPVVAVDHVHAPRVSVREQALLIAARLRRGGAATFRGLSADSPDILTTVARFLALLELYRDGKVAFEQVRPLGELHVRWTGAPELPAGQDGGEALAGAGAAGAR